MLSLSITNILVRLVIACLCLLLLPSLATRAQSRKVPSNKRKININLLNKTPQESEYGATVTISIEPDGSGTFGSKSVGPMRFFEGLGGCENISIDELNFDAPREWQPQLVGRTVGSSCELTLSLQFSDISMLNRQFVAVSGQNNYGFICQVNLEQETDFNIRIKKEPAYGIRGREKIIINSRLIIETPNIRTYKGSYSNISASQKDGCLLVWSPPSQGVYELQVFLGLGIEVPSLPLGASYLKNISEARKTFFEAQKMLGKGNESKYTWLWFLRKVQPGGEWDYKTTDLKKYEDSGNFHYGVIGAALEIDDTTLLRMAGYVQELIALKPGRKAIPEEWGNAGSILNIFDIPLGGTGSGYFGDQPKDQIMIRAGIAWYKQKYEKKSSCGGR